MNLKSIEEVLKQDLPKRTKEELILIILSRDEKVIPMMIEIIAKERDRKKDISNGLNLLLSKAHAALDTPKLNKSKFIQKEIFDFYDESGMKSCFNIDRNRAVNNG